MSCDVIKNAIELFAKIPGFDEEIAYIDFHGGEPLLNCEAIECVMEEMEINFCIVVIRQSKFWEVGSHNC